VGDALIVLGTSSDDIDADGTPGVAGPFVMALEANTGAQRWVKQLEGSTKFARKLTFTGGQVRWVTDVQPNVLPGVTAAAMHLVSFDVTTGATSAFDFTNVGSNGNYALNKVAAGQSMEQLADGSSVWFLAPFTQFNNAPGVTQLNISATGVMGGGSTSSAGEVNALYSLQSSSANGSRFAYALDYRTSQCTAGGSQIIISGGSVLNSCPAPNPARLIALDARGGVAVANFGTAGDTVQLRPIISNGIAAWTKDFTNLFATGARVTSLEADAVNQYYVGVKGLSGGAQSAVVIFGPAGNELDTLRLGNATTRVASTHRDTVGNLFLGATSIGGFTLFGAGLGGDDLVLSRNPQITFGN